MSAFLGLFRNSMKSVRPIVVRQIFRKNEISFSRFETVFFYFTEYKLFFKANTSLCSIFINVAVGGFQCRQVNEKAIAN
jgi:hypothetical protein